MQLLNSCFLDQHWTFVLFSSPEEQWPGEHSGRPVWLFTHGMPATLWLKPSGWWQSASTSSTWTGRPAKWVFPFTDSLYFLLSKPTLLHTLPVLTGLQNEPLDRSEPNGAPVFHFPFQYEHTFCVKGSQHGVMVTNHHVMHCLIHAVTCVNKGMWWVTRFDASRSCASCWEMIVSSVGWAHTRLDGFNWVFSSFCRCSR